MAGTYGNYWLWWAGSVGVGLVLLLVGLWALYAGRPRGRVCPRCHFNLTGSDSLTCPNCGFTARTVRKFRARARHPWIALTCFVLLNVGTVATVLWQFQPSWMSMMPGRVLVMLLPMSDARDGLVATELRTRIRTQSLSERDLRALIDRCVQGDAHVRPVDQAWQESYGQLLHTLRSMTPPESSLLEGTHTIPISMQLFARERWPTDTAICVQVRVEDWWPKGTMVRLTATPNIPGAKPSTFVRTGWYMPANRYAIFLPAMEEGAHEITYDVKVERRNVLRQENWQPAGMLHQSVHVVVKGAMDDVLPPANDSQLDDTIADVFSVGIARWASGISPLRVYFLPEQTFVPAFEGVAIGVSVRVLHGEQVVRRMNLWWLGGPQDKSTDQWSLGWEVPWEDHEAIMSAPGNDGKWSVQVVGLQDVALRVVGATHYWEGAVRVPTELAEREGESPPVPWLSMDDN